jgi:hypothetical protein
MERNRGAHPVLNELHRHRDFEHSRACPICSTVSHTISAARYKPSGHDSAAHEVGIAKAANGGCGDGVHCRGEISCLSTLGDIPHTKSQLSRIMPRLSAYAHIGLSEPGRCLVACVERVTD